MKFAFAAILAFVLALSTNEVSAEQVNLTTQQAIDLFSAIKSLDGYIKIIKDANTEKAISATYKLSAATRIVLAKDYIALRPSIEAYQDVYNAKLTELGKDNTKFAEVNLELLKVPVSVELERLSNNDLALDENPIPPTVLGALSVILR